MAERQQQGRQSGEQEDPVEITQRPEEAAGVSAGQVKRTSERKKAEVEDAVVHKPDLKLGVTQEPDHPADKTSYPGPENPPLERPPFATTRPDEPIVRSAITGAGEHVPPDPDKYDEMGRPRDAGDRS